ncbi:MAG: CPBP family intramembrane metalloprotease [Dehalococcoidia bacterium]|nr:CPBP family intramembrane metalloprotease [Dehalococcoidia bacterium]
MTPQGWGPKQVVIGLALAGLSFVFTAGLLVALVAAVGADYQLRDVGDWFDKANAVAKYADERLQAAATGKELPAPPRITADMTAVKLGFATTLVYESLLIAIAGGATKETFTGLVKALGLHRYNVMWLWRPALFVVAAYLFTGLYVIAMQAIGIDFLVPQSTVPDAVTRDAGAMAIATVVAAIAAPISEETFFRGFVFTGLLRWGFWPAAAVSAGLFTLAHLDPGSIIPFFCIGIALAYLYWSRGSLWESIAFHAMFNSVSILLLYAGR